MTILNEVPIYKVYPSAIFIIILIIFCILIFFVIGLLATTEGSFTAGGICLFIAFIFLILYCHLSSINFGRYDTGEKKLEVILEDTFSANELYREYKVIERRGDIWVLKKKK